MASYATAQGTSIYREQAIQNGISDTHFSVFDNLHLSGLGMGTYLGDIDERTNDMVIQATIQSVLSGSINVIDTAINYRSQLAERSVGIALQRLMKRDISRDQLFLSSKVGYIPGDGELGYTPRAYLEQILMEQSIVHRREIVDDMHSMHPDFLKHQIHQSLANLQFDTIDLMYLHNIGETQLPRIGERLFVERLHSSFEYLEQLRERGKIKYYGLATWNSFRVPPDHENYLNLEDIVGIAHDVGGKDHGFRFIQVPVNLALPEAMTEYHQVLDGEVAILLKAARELGIGVFSSVPLMQTRLFNYQIPPVEGYTPAQVCLEFVRSIPEILSPLVGHKLAEHVTENTELGKFDCLDVSTYRSTFFQM